MLDTFIKRARQCTESHQLYAICEEISQQISDTEEALSRSEYAYNWFQIETVISRLAVLKYAYKTIEGWADDMDDDERALAHAWDCHEAQMGDRI
tara:strand:+ start:922 stop:1206 length:285 start_codon:yes stop_codon:yes gene_type:complete